MKIALISCAKSKRNYPCQAKEMYSPSSLFKYSYEYAKRVADKVYILSAQYGLIDENANIVPYERTLNGKSSELKHNWAVSVITQMKKRVDLENDEFIILAGKDYNQYLLPSLKHYQLPLGNRQLGARIAYLKSLLEDHNNCLTMHRLFATTKRYRYDQIPEIPFKNGIYLFFEKGETYREYDRIVRVGSHVSEGRLSLRLKDHFFTENKDGSIFRKNIGKAILNQRSDPYLKTWTLDSRMEENKKYVNHEKQVCVEKQVTQYLRENMSFTCFPVVNKEQRLRLENGIIATLHEQIDFRASENWLGQWSPVYKVKESGLWLSIGLDHQVLSEDELQFIVQYTPGKKSSHAIQLQPPKITVEPQKSQTKGNVTTNDVRKHLFNKLQSAKEKGLSSLNIKASDIAKEISLQNRFPMICEAMRSIKGYEKYVIIYAPPKGNGSSVEYKYDLG